MDINSLKLLLFKLNLGEVISSPEVVTGGLLHKMYKVKTTTGKYAIKLLNPNIMKRENVIKNFIFSEKISKIAEENNIPAITSIGNEIIYEMNNYYYMVFKWSDSKNILTKDININQCASIGRILAQIHSIKFKFEDKYKDNNNKELIDWKQYLNSSCTWNKEFNSILKELENLSFKLKEVYHNKQYDMVISHRDLDSKNVLWDVSNNPVIIDWESSGYIDKIQELIETALSFAGIETDSFDIEKLKAVIYSYESLNHINKSNVNASIILSFENKLNWLEYNIKRSLGIESIDEEEQELGTKEVIKTINSIKKQIELTSVIKEIFN